MRNFFESNPTFVTNGAMKKELLLWGEFVSLSHPSLLEAVNNGEKWADEKNNAGLITTILHYPLTVALAKALKVKEKLQSLNNELRKKTFAVFDSTWSYEDHGTTYYINKPSTHPLGSVIGVQAMEKFFFDNQGLAVKNTSGTVFFKQDEIIGGTMISVDTGRINTISEEQKPDLKTILFSNRQIVAAGLNTIEAWEKGFVIPPSELMVEVANYSFFDNLLNQFMDNPNVYQPWVNNFSRFTLESQSTNEGFNKILLGFLFGVLPKGLVLTDS